MCNVSKFIVYAMQWLKMFLTCFIFLVQVKFESGVLLLSTHRLLWRDQKNHVSPAVVSCMSINCEFHNKQLVACNEKTPQTNFCTFCVCFILHIQSIFWFAAERQLCTRNVLSPTAALIKLHAEMRRGGNITFSSLMAHKQSRRILHCVLEIVGFDNEGENVTQNASPMLLVQQGPFFLTAFPSPRFPVFWSQQIVPDHGSMIGIIWWQYQFVQVLSFQLPLVVLNHLFNNQYICLYFYGESIQRLSGSVRTSV